MTSSEKTLIANHMKNKNLNRRQRAWVKRQSVDRRSTIIVNSIFMVIAVIGWFWIIWVGVGL